ncbi:SDR family NAD(P)-dependent oxidoreductase [Zhongshania aquimaris]|uniref:SDR family oxidoreductase n=1 Tax=Zhongshania aquimaris TaxID=2857107 RepID=A0ABS6VV21_9GAMM|nr:SDR family oxidoreductase [Zhongshania aquimaris]MBW2942186.1 SDR family oxidoreductase [Zhongshania aquimaris]
MNVVDGLYPEGVALVFGGSGGVGSAICSELASKGVNVVSTYNSNVSRATEMAEEIRASGGSIGIAKLSMDDLSGMQKLVADLAEQYGRIHSVFIATGFDIPQINVRDVSPDQWQRVLRADVEGVFNIVYTTLPYLKKGGGGSYVHISSAALQRFAELDILSVAPKAAIEELIKGIAKEEGKYNVRANSIAIGVIETGIFLRLEKDGVFNDAWKSEVLKMLPMNRFGKPEEVANMALFLGSSLASYTTGQLIPVDGGFGI